MIIRNYIEEDEKKIQELATKNKVLIPEEGYMLVAEDDNGNIVGFLNLRNVMMIEPFICENPYIAKKLFDEAVIQAKSNDQMIMRGFVKDDKVLKVAEKGGFQEIFENYKIIELFIPPITVGEIKQLREKKLLKNSNIN